MKNPSRTCSGRDFYGFGYRAFRTDKVAVPSETPFMFIRLSILKQILHPDKGFGRHGEPQPIAINQIADCRELV